MTDIRAGRLFNTENGQLLTNQVVLVHGDRIMEVGSADQVKIPAGAKVIDLSTETVLPFGPTGELWVRPTFTLAEVEAAVDEAHRQHAKVSCDAYGGKGLKYCVMAGVESIEHGHDIDDAEMSMMLQKGIYWDTTIYRYCMPER